MRRHPKKLFPKTRRTAVSALRRRAGPGRLLTSAATEESPWLPGRRCGSASLGAHRPLERVATAEAVTDWNRVPRGRSAKFRHDAQNGRPIAEGDPLALPPGYRSEEHPRHPLTAIPAPQAMPEAQLPIGIESAGLGETQDSVGARSPETPGGPPLPRRGLFSGSG